MSQLFPRWANSAVRAALIVGITLLAGAPIALLAWARSPSATGKYAIVEQPVAFSHPLHVNGERIDHSFDDLERPPYQLHRLLTRRVVGSEVLAPEWFALRFESGEVLRNRSAAGGSP